MRRFLRPAPVIAFGLSVVLLAGCSKTRLKQQTPSIPKIAESEQWSTKLAGGTVAKAADDQLLAHWWSTFNDPTLTSLEERAVQANLDVRIAQAKIREARAARNIVKSDRLPAVSASGSSSVSRSSEKSGSGRTSDLYSAGFDASWEPDIFGKTYYNIQAAEATLQAREEDLRDTLVTLTAEVAVNYVDVRSYQQRIAVAKANRDSQKETYDLAVMRYEAGLVTQLVVEQAKASLENTRAQIPTLEAGLEQAKNRLAVLLGEKPGALSQELEAAKPVPVSTKEIAVGVRADLLRRRPDIRGIERQISSQAAQAGVVRTELYPSFSLSGSLGLDALSLKDLFSPSAIAANIAGSVKHTIFDRRQIRENVNQQNAVLDQLIGQYESTVLTAVEDVENALDSFAREQVRRESLQQAVVAARKAEELSRNLYDTGSTDFLDVLDAQRTLLSYQDSLAQSDANVTTYLIQLYKAMGGGWDSVAAAPPASGTTPVFGENRKPETSAQKASNPGV